MQEVNHHEIWIFQLFTKGNNLKINSHKNMQVYSNGCLYVLALHQPFIFSPEKVVHYVDNMLGHKLTTKQTPPGGVLVKKVMIAEALNIISEKYFAILLDWETNGPLIVGSHKGGMDIEEVARTDPGAIFKVFRMKFSLLNTIMNIM